MDNIGDKLNRINKTLERQNKIIQQMLDIMPKPANKFGRTLETVVLIISAFGFISLIDIVIKWIRGG